MSGVTSTMVWKDAIIKENRCRRAYYLGRFGPGAVPKEEDKGFYDPYNNDEVSAISVHRAVAIPAIAGHGSWDKLRHTGRLVVQTTTDAASPAKVASRPASCASMAPSQKSVASEATQRSRRSRSSRSVASLRTAVEDAVESELSQLGLTGLKAGTSMEGLATGAA
mmetsp:Transcript_15569/g.36700  ORF Transcript_15569/g.36700 Transcript_15569/m.36700 type:complete len:166 (+) Transcript_15569:57-554(+)